MNANLKNCSACGKLFIAKPKQKLCLDCFEELQAEEARIIRYVDTHKEAATLDKICEGTGAEPRMILRMIHDSRFLHTDVDISYPCESCGAPITRGRYCAGCMHDFKVGAERFG